MKDSDKLVLGLLEKVKQKQQEIENITKVSWLTSCTVGYNPDTVNDRVNIQTVSDVSKLVDLYSFLSEKEKSWENSFDELGITLKMKWMGYSISDWKKDIKTRINRINVGVKKKELDELEKRVNSLVTPEQRRELELAELTKILS